MDKYLKESYDAALKKIETLQGQLVRMREALSRIQLEAFGEDGDFNNSIGSLEHLIHDTLSQTQDVTAWHQASLLRAKAEAVKDAVIAAEDGIEVGDVSPLSLAILSEFKVFLQGEAAALRKQADGLEARK